jgi:hypothetical protein
VIVDAGRGRADGGRGSPPHDAPRVTLAIDAGVTAPAPSIDAASAMTSIDAAPAPAIDAAAALALVAVTFVFDTWCDLTVDGSAHGRVTGKTITIRLAPGRHHATCSQGPGLGSWSSSIEVAPGAASRVTGELLPRVDVVVDVGDGARIDGFTVPRGSALTIRAGSHRVQVVTDGKVGPEVRIEVPGAPRCTLRDQPKLGCYP